MTLWEFMASFATYTNFHMEKNDGTYKPLLKNVQQHHSELLQAVLLTIPSTNGVCIL